MKPDQEDVLSWQMKLVEEVNFLKNHRAELEAKLEKIQKVVNEQAEDEGLWSFPCDSDGNLKLQPIGEAMLQQALRRLHAVIEGEDR